jgi:hypothetical protein
MSKKLKKFRVFYRERRKPLSEKIVEYNNPP